MFRRMLDNVRDYIDLCNSVAIGITLLARALCKSSALTHAEKMYECGRLLDLYRSVEFHRIRDNTEEAMELAIILRCVPRRYNAEWNIAARLQPAYVYT